MATFKKDGHLIQVEVHPQPFGTKLYEAVAPDGYSWGGECWSIHGDSLADLKQRAAHTELVPTEDDADL